MEHREATARGIWYLHERKYWSLARIRDFTEIPVKDIPDLVREGAAYVLHDKSRDQSIKFCGRRLRE